MCILVATEVKLIRRAKKNASIFEGERAQINIHAYSHTFHHINRPFAVIDIFRRFGISQIQNSRFAVHICANVGMYVLMLICFVYAALKSRDDQFSPCHHLSRSEQKRSSEKQRARE